ncbi:MAG: winged helix-turn-helix domain-containing protein [Planctomycetota bacterium]
MKKKEVKIGGRYLAKVSGSVSPVRLDAESPYGGWDGTNLDTGRQVRIKSAQRLRGEFNPYKEDGTMAKKKSTKTAAKAEKAKAAKTEKPAAKTAEPKARKIAARADGTLSGLDAAAKVMAEAGEPLGCKVIVERAIEKGYWKPGGKTPAATIYSAILREMQKKGDQARFRKAERGKFALKTS